MRSSITKRFNEFQSLHAAILTTCEEFPDKTAIYDRRGNALKYADIENQVKCIAGGLFHEGVRKGDRIGLVSENCSRWGIVYLAILAAGGVVVPFDSALKREELIGLLKVSQVKLLFCSEKWYQPISELINRKELSINLISLYGSEGKSFENLRQSDPYVTHDTKADDTSVIIYTSGTTGSPKGVILTHGNILANLDSVNQALPFYDTDIFLSILPPHHTFEATCGFLVPLSLGLTIAYAGSLKSRDLINDIKKYNVSVMVAVPLVYEKLYKAIRRRLKQLPFIKKILLDFFFKISSLGHRISISLGRLLFKGLREKGGLDSIRMFISGGAPLPKHIGEWFNLIGFCLLEGYGMTECSPVLAVNRPDNICAGSVGPPLPDVEIKINKPGENGIGEIIVRGANNTQGYLDNPEATAGLLRESWLYTGDMGRIEKGRLFITGRSKNIIISGGGKNIFPEEIELYLNQSDYILESLVIGRKKTGKTGEDIWAIIVPDDEQMEMELAKKIETISDKQIREIIAKVVKDVNNHMADYKRIVNFEIRTEEFEKTTSRKIKRTIYK